MAEFPMKIPADSDGTQMGCEAIALRACFRIWFGVPPLGGPAPKPPEGGTPNPGADAQAGILNHALSHGFCQSGFCLSQLPPL
jgi:hypothetical protein